MTETTDKKLLEACEICIADMGKEDEELVKKLYDKMHTTFVEKGRMWNYANVDNCLHKMLGLKRA